MRSSRSTLRRLVPGLVVCVLLVLGALLVPAEDARGPERPDAEATGDRVAALEVLRAWDQSRAGAWRAADPAALRRLYVPGSTAGRADRALLAAYAGRGLRVEGMRMQVAAAEVVLREEDRIVLHVTDRLAGAVAVGEEGEVALPQDGWSRRSVELVRAGERWRVAEVTGQATGQARPVAITAETSGSSKR